eukprot:COSAG01_NODE_1626_length_9689_cov_12.495412_8_plen_146_part_00
MQRGSGGQWPPPPGMEGLDIDKLQDTIEDFSTPNGLSTHLGPHPATAAFCVSPLSSSFSPSLARYLPRVHLPACCGGGSHTPPAWLAFIAMRQRWCVLRQRGVCAARLYLTMMSVEDYIYDDRTGHGPVRSRHTCAPSPQPPLIA